MENKTKKKLNKVDIVILLLLVLCLVGVALRFVVIKTTPDPDTNPDVPAEEYILSFITRDHRYNTLDFLKADTEFRFYETNNVFGKIASANKSPAQKWYYNSEGEYIMVYNDAENEEKLADPFAQSIAARYDIDGTILVKGKYNADGVFIIEGSEKINVVLNKPFLLRSDEMIISVHITDITKLGE